MSIEFPAQFKPLLEHHPYKVLYGGRDGVKSWSIAQALVMLGAGDVPGWKEPLRILCGRETMDSIRESVHQLLQDQIGRLGLGDFYRVLQSEIRGPESHPTEIVFAGLRKQSVSSIKSYEGFDIFWGEEASTVRRRSLQILEPTLRKPGSEIWWSLNPDLDDDPVYTDYVLNPPPGAWVHKTSYLDNKWLSKESRQKIETLRLRDPDTFAHVYGGATRSTVEGAIYKDEIRKAEMEGRIRQVPCDTMRAVDVFFDLGYADRVAIWAAQRLPFEVRILRYYENDHQAIDHYLKEIQSWGYVVGTCYLPWDGGTRSLGTGKSIEEMMRAQGFKTHVNRQLSVADGINAVRMLFPQLYFDANLCADGLQYLRRYQWGPTTNLGVARREPLHDDACFHPETKVLTRYGRRRIMELPDEGEVMTPCGWKHYTNLRITRRNAPLVVVQFDDGYTVRCTPEHLFMTVNGWKSAELLTPGTPILCGSIPLPSTSEAVSIAFGRARHICAQAVGHFIGMLGNQRLGRFHLAAISTTRTAKPSITFFQTSNVFPRESIFSRIGKRSTRPVSLPHLLGQQQPNGTVLRPVAFGTSGKPSDVRLGFSGSEKRGLASGAVEIFRRLFARADMPTNIVRNRARVRRIISVSKMQKTSDVCCLHVEDGNWFCLENGAVVHNSHPADALRTMAVGIKEPKGVKPKTEPRRPAVSAWG